MNKKRLGAFSLASVMVISGTVYSKETIKGLISEKPETYVESISTIKKTVNYSNDNFKNIKSEEPKVSEEKTEYIASLENLNEDSKLEKNTVSVNYVNNNVEQKENKVQEIKVQKKEVKEDVELSSVSKEEVKTENVVEDSKKVEESKPIEKEESEVPVVSGNTLSDTDKEIIAPTIETDESKVIELPVKGYITRNLNVRSSAVIDDNNIVGVLPVGSEISGTESNGWIKISYEGKTAYISRDFISNTKVKVEEPKAEKVEETKEEKPEVKEQAKEPVKEEAPGKAVEGWLTSALNLREGQGTDTKVLTVIPKGTKVSGIESNGWVKIKYNSLTGYVAKSYISDKEVKVEEVKEEVEEIKESTNNVSSNAAINNIVGDAYKYLGYKYVYASANPSVGFDCSGLVYYLYKTHAGVTLNRSSRDQALNGYAVSRDSLKPGDLLFFSTFGGNRITHVGLYVGDGKMIHASTPKEGVIITDVNSNYYVKNFMTARRVLD